MKTYLARFTPAQEGGGVEFTDFDGCLTEGGDFAESVHRATDVLALWLANNPRLAPEEFQSQVKPVIQRVPVPVEAKLF